MNIFFILYFNHDLKKYIQIENCRPSASRLHILLKRFYIEIWIQFIKGQREFLASKKRSIYKNNFKANPYIYSQYEDSNFYNSPTPFFPPGKIETNSIIKK